jgi:hypothetical protein
MKKSLLLAACLALPFAALAADGQHESKKHAPKAENAASAAHPAASAGEARMAAQASKDRGSKMGACRKEVTDQGLQGAEYKAALSACMQK